MVDPLGPIVLHGTGGGVREILAGTEDAALLLGLRWMETAVVYMHPGRTWCEPVPYRFAAGEE